MQYIFSCASVLTTQRFLAYFALRIVTVSRKQLIIVRHPWIYVKCWFGKSFPKKIPEKVLFKIMYNC